MASWNPDLPPPAHRPPVSVLRRARAHKRRAARQGPVRSNKGQGPAVGMAAAAHLPVGGGDALRIPTEKKWARFGKIFFTQVNENLPVKAPEQYSVFGQDT